MVTWQARSPQSAPLCAICASQDARAFSSLSALSTPLDHREPLPHALPTKPMCRRGRYESSFVRPVLARSLCLTHVHELAANGSGCEWYDATFPRGLAGLVPNLVTHHDCTEVLRARAPAWHPCGGEAAALCHERFLAATAIK